MAHGSRYSFILMESKSIFLSEHQPMPLYSTSKPLKQSSIYLFNILASTTVIQHKKRLELSGKYSLTLKIMPIYAVFN